VKLNNNKKTDHKGKRKGIIIQLQEMFASYMVNFNEATQRSLRSISKNSQIEWKTYLSKILKNFLMPSQGVRNHF
jgi:hypothetical protein